MSLPKPPSMKEHFLAGPEGHIDSSLKKFIEEWPDDKDPSAYQLKKILDYGCRYALLSNMVIMIFEVMLATQQAREGLTDAQVDAYANENWRKGMH